MEKKTSQSRWQNLIKEKKHSLQIFEKRTNNLTIGQRNQPFLIMLFISFILLGTIGSRLFFLQLIEGESYRNKAEKNSVRIMPKPPIRGNIYDTKGRILASTRFTHSAYLWPIVISKSSWPENRKYLAKLLALPEKSIEAKISESKNKKIGYSSPTLIRIASRLNPAQITELEEFKTKLNGLEIDVESIRNYPNKEIAAHILGYTGELSSEELQNRNTDGYRLGDSVGRMGIEAAYEKKLRGEWGGIELEINGTGRITKILGRKVAKSGQDITLTLDLDIQKAAEVALKQHTGAIVVIKPHTGEVLAMASSPTFDPNFFSTPIAPKVWGQLQSKNKSFVNRALQSFPPASTFKIVTATAGMELEKYPSNTILQTFPYLNVKGENFKEWDKLGFGKTGYIKALALGSNAFYRQIGLKVGENTLAKYANLYGFGSKTGIELEEDSGLVANKIWKQKKYQKNWTERDTVNMSIGQGFTKATPLQIAVMFSILANGGYAINPHLLKKVDNKEYIQNHVNLKNSTIQTLREGLRAAVLSGTEKTLKTSNLPPVAGKSGIVEKFSDKSYAWFGGFAPYSNPEVVVVAFIKYSDQEKESIAALIVREVMETYFKHNS